MTNTIGTTPQHNIIYSNTNTNTNTNTGIVSLNASNTNTNTNHNHNSSNNNSHSNNNISTPIRIPHIISPTNPLPSHQSSNKYQSPLSTLL